MISLQCQIFNGHLPIHGGTIYGLPISNGNVDNNPIISHFLTTVIMAIVLETDLIFGD